MRLVIAFSAALLLYPSIASAQPCVARPLGTAHVPALVASESASEAQEPDELTMQKRCLVWEFSLTPRATFAPSDLNVPGFHAVLASPVRVSGPTRPAVFVSPSEALTLRAPGLGAFTLFPAEPLLVPGVATVPANTSAP